MLSVRRSIAPLACLGLLAGALAIAGTASGAKEKFVIWSPAFHGGAQLPARFSCDGVDVSPPLRWSAPPKGTESLAIALRDPDAPHGTFTHWLGWGMSAKAGSLATNRGAPMQGRNDFGTIGYAGPCPPRGSKHHYVFELYALDSQLTLKPGASAKEFDAAVRTHVLALTAVTATFLRPAPIYSPPAS